MSSEHALQAHNPDSLFPGVSAVQFTSGPSLFVMRASIGGKLNKMAEC